MRALFIWKLNKHFADLAAWLKWLREMFQWGSPRHIDNFIWDDLVSMSHERISLVSFVSCQKFRSYSFLWSGWRERESENVFNEKEAGKAAALWLRNYFFALLSSYTISFLNCCIKTASVHFSTNDQTAIKVKLNSNKPNLSPSRSQFYSATE